MFEKHKLMGGKLRLYKRSGTDAWQCATFLNGRHHRVSTKEDSLSHAKDFAEDWYLEMRGKSRAGLLKRGKTFRDAAERFKLEYEVITMGERSPAHINRLKSIIEIHLMPFFGKMVLSEITPGVVQDYRVHRHSNPRPRPKQKPENAKPPSRRTLHQEVIALRHVLKTAERHG